MAENSLVGASDPVLVSLAIAGASVLGALVLQVGSNVLSDEISVRWQLGRRRMLRVRRLAYGLRLAKGHRRRVRRLMLHKGAPRPVVSGVEAPLVPLAAPVAAADNSVEAQLAHAEALAERELRKLIALLCASERDAPAFAFPFGDVPLDPEGRREKVVAALERRAVALLRRGRGGNCRV